MAVAEEMALAEEGTGTAVEAAETVEAEAGGLPTLNNLNNQLPAEEAAGAFTESGELSQEAIDNSQQIIDPADIGNPDVPDRFRKYTTQSYQSPAGPFQVHLYMDPATGEVFYGLDFKAIFNAGVAILQFP
jgi:hypothetical protein